jgi:hypothetical protein
MYSKRCGKSTINKKTASDFFSLLPSDCWIFFSFVKKLAAMKNILMVVFLFSYVGHVCGQDDESLEQTHRAGDVGIGLGLDYGGIGARVGGLVSPGVELFLGVGYNIAEIGWNAGGLFRLAPDKRVCPTLTAMYGYNAVIVIKGPGQDLEKVYRGPSFGGGLEVKSRSSDNFWHFQLFVPIRSSEYKDDIDALDNDANIEMTKPWPITISVGYHFSF